MGKRKSGILLHITSLPDSPGIGTLGKKAYEFADWLKEGKQSYWQILPLGPTGYGDSPYASFSTFAGNPLLIDLDLLVKKGWARAEEVVPPDYIKKDGPVDFGSVVWWKIPLLYKCAQFFLAGADNKSLKAYEKFKQDNQWWLDNFASFTSIKKFYDAKAQEENIQGIDSMWNRFWPEELKAHNQEAVEKWNKEHLSDVEQIKVIQFFFGQQWSDLKNYCNKQGIKIIGDIPIFVAADSADVWADQWLFQFNSQTHLQTACAGVPPDYFSATGQLWGNPLYDWDAMKKDNYSWWVKRIKNMLRLVDVIRIDHFRGFESYWQVPYGAENAIKGKWLPGPGKELFDTIADELGPLPIIAEDLGIITPEVEALRDSCNFPGMKILQFAFNDQPWSEESEKNLYLPENFTTENCVVYTATHDNDTSAGSLKNNPIQYKKNILSYFGWDENLSDEEICSKLVEEAFCSKADTCIIPLQDIFAIGSEGRMNQPSTTGANWCWRMKNDCLDWSSAEKLKALSKKGRRN